MSRFRRAGYDALRRLSVPWRMATRVGPPRLRILAYHDIPDGKRFDMHMSHLNDLYQVVNGPHFEPGAERQPVWITFDDGDPTIIDNAMGVLSEYGFSATAFICPAVIDSSQPYWWQIVLAACDAGVEIAGKRLDPGEVSRLKVMPDERRRRRVAEIQTALSDQGVDLNRRQLTRVELNAWLEAGHSLGNHSWDHPILDRCSPDEQNRQVELSHRWFLDNGYGAPRWFAYPNGNRSTVTDRQLAEHGYEASLLFDHRLASMSTGMSLSRIRVNGTDTLSEFIPKVSGIHPMTLRLRP